MQNDQIYSEIINLVETYDDFNLMNNQLDILEKSLYELKADSNFDFVLKNSISESFANLITQLVKDKAEKDKKEVLEKIREALKEVQFFELTLSSDPTRKTIENISKWLSATLKQKVAIDIKIDPDILGGAIISYNGKYFDGSVRSKLDGILKNYI